MLVLVGLVVLLAWIPLRQHLGIGTILNTLSIGFIANLGLAWIPDQHALAPASGSSRFAIVGFGLGGGLYIGWGLGPGPRDGLMTAITARGTGSGSCAPSSSAARSWSGSSSAARSASARC